MKRLMISIILVVIPFWTLEGAYGRDSGQPAKASTASNRYHCVKHPEINASWPARCPKCGAHLVRRQRSKQMVSGRTEAEEMRHKIMMNTVINVFDPEAILCAKRPLALTKEQIKQLETISMTARQCAKKVLNDKQRNRLNTLEKVPRFPATMAKMHRKMMDRMSPESMMLKMMQDQMKTKDPKGMTHAPSNTPEPDPARGINIRRDSDREMPSNQFHDNVRDNFRDRYRDNLRDRYRDFYRDHYRDNLRDRLRDGYFNYPYFRNNDEGFGYDEGFGNDEGFGYDEGFGNDEGFGGDEGFGYDEGFGSDEGFGEEGGEENEH